jgi:hypothetical protein
MNGVEQHAGLSVFYFYCDLNYYYENIAKKREEIPAL